MLASTAPSLEELEYPIILQPKWDGVRAILTESTFTTRTLKDVPNVLLRQRALEAFKVSKIKKTIILDGELVAFKKNKPLPYNETESLVATRYSPAKAVRFVVFDIIDDEMTAADRQQCLKDIFLKPGFESDFLFRSPTHICHALTHVNALYARYLKEKMEGVILRRTSACYKHGRSTKKEQALLKLKPVLDAEAEVIGIQQLMKNLNPPQKTATGHTKRSSHKKNLKPQPALGALVCRDCKSKVVFSIGTGFTQQERIDLWEKRDTLIGSIVTYTYLDRVSNIPHSASFKRIRKMN